VGEDIIKIAKGLPIANFCMGQNNVIVEIDKNIVVESCKGKWGKIVPTHPFLTE